MWPRISIFDSQYPKELRAFSVDTFHYFMSAQKRWEEEHGVPQPEYPARDYLIAAAMQEAIELTHGNAQLVTPELVEFIYAGLAPDPEFYSPDQSDFQDR